jgi:hypothetical protein
MYAMATAMVMAAAVCGDAAAETPRKARPTPAPARHVRPAAWSATSVNLAWPSTAKRRALVVSRGWAEDENFVWFIADGRTVVSVYRTSTRSELDTAITMFVRNVVLVAQGSPTDSTSWGIAGSISKPPPPPPEPEPGGFPEYYVEQVMKISMSLDDNVLVPQLGTIAPVMKQQPGIQQVNPATKATPAKKATKP